MLDELTTIHQKARAYVEQKYPGYKVRSVAATSTSTYMPTLATRGTEHPEYILFQTDINFLVSAMKDPPHLIYPMNIHCRLRMANGEIFDPEEVTVS